MNKTRRYSPKARERAVRVAFEHETQHDSHWATIRSIAALRGEVEEVEATIRETVAAGFGLELTGVGLSAMGLALGTWGPSIF